MSRLIRLLSILFGAVFALIVCMTTVTPSQGAGAQATSPFNKERVTFKNGDLTLVGYVYKPDGDGPFPALVWNHGSEQNPGTGPEFDGVASLFVPAGYVVFAPMRRGHSDSQGTYIQDALKDVLQKQGKEAATQFFVQQMTGPQLDDQLAGQAYLKTLPYVDKSRLAVIGCSYGGIETIFAAERGADYKAAVAISPAAESWQGNKPLQDRMIKAVSGINIPTLIIHPEKDASTAPGYALGQEFQRLGKPYGLIIYPPFGSEAQQGHCFGGVKGFSIFAPDALTFLSNVLK